MLYQLSYRRMLRCGREDPNIQELMLAGLSDRCVFQFHHSRMKAAVDVAPASGACRDRTGGLLLARQALSHLS